MCGIERKLYPARRRFCDGTKRERLIRHGPGELMVKQAWDACGIGVSAKRQRSSACVRKCRERALALLGFLQGSIESGAGSAGILQGSVESRRWLRGDFCKEVLHGIDEKTVVL